MIFQKQNAEKIENNYPTATIEDICKHAPKTTENAILFLWATAPKLREAMQVVDAWGFEYKTHAIWDKCKIGMGYWFRGQHELLIVATKGNASPPIAENRVSSIFKEPRGEHSKKPDCVYEWIESAFVSYKKLEMYARSNRPGLAFVGAEGMNDFKKDLEYSHSCEDDPCWLEIYRKSISNYDRYNLTDKRLARAGVTGRSFYKFKSW